MARTVSYKDFGPKFTLSVDDSLLLYGILYKVQLNDCTNRYYLKNISEKLHSRNDAIFAYIYRISDTDKYKWSNAFGSTLNGSFPEFYSLEALTKFVKNIYETSPYRCGDRVKVKSREAGSGTYPYNFVDEMAELAGREFEIKFVQEDDSYVGDPNSRPSSDGSIFNYEFAQDSWTWHSSMFEPAETALRPIWFLDTIASKYIETSEAVETARKAAAEIQKLNEKIIGSGSGSSTTQKDIITLPKEATIKIKL